MRSIRSFLPVAIAIGIVAGCASAPDPLKGNYAESPRPDQTAERLTKASVRWGGTIVETQVETGRTCVEILAKELDATGRPRHTDKTVGRFLACRNESVDPEVFGKAREATVVGKVIEFRKGKVGEFDYRYPVVDADIVYLWRERTDSNAGVDYDGDLFYRAFEPNLGSFLF